MWRALALLIALGSTAAPGSTSVHAQSPAASNFMSPAIDRNIFREGEVQRVSGNFGSWRVVCDVVARLNQRFCSLFGTAKDKDGRPLVGVVVTTTDKGQPAALLRLPTEVTVGSIVEISTSAASTAIAKGQKAAKKAAAKKEKTGSKLRLTVVSCDPKNCMTLWKLSPEQIGVLNSAGSLHVHYALKDAAAAQWEVGTTSGIGVDATVDGAGFVEAVNATMGSNDLLH